MLSSDEYHQDIDSASAYLVTKIYLDIYFCQRQLPENH